MFAECIETAHQHFKQAIPRRILILEMKILRQDLLVDAMGYLLRLRPAGPWPLLFLAGNANENDG